MRLFSILLTVITLLVASAPVTHAETITVAQERQRGVDRANAYRKQVGLPAATVASPLVYAAAGHAKYQLEAGELGHYETNKASSSYIAYGPLERAKKYGYTSTGVSEDWMGTTLGSTGARTYLAADNAVQWWMDAVYHRFPIIRPGTKALGFGAYRKNNLSVSVLNFGTNLNVSGPLVRWPRANATGVGVSVSNESPNPLAVCGLSSTTMGYPVSMTWHTGTVSATSMVLKRADTGASVAGCKLTPGNDKRHADSKSISFVPTKPLAFGTKYTVTFKGTRSGTAFNYTWSFTTMPAPGRLVSSSPASGSVGVALQPKIALNFSRAIRSYTLVRTPYSQLSYTGIGASLTPASGGSEVGFTFTQPSGYTTRTVYLTPSSQLQPNTKYRLSFAFADQWGRPQRGTVYFTTGQ